VEKQTCLFIAPLGEAASETRIRYEWLIQGIVQPAVDQCGYALIRPDEFSEAGLISSHIIQKLVDADVVIADISASNPNVMYELGIRHSTQKPVIQLANRLDRIPFDLAHFRIIRYDLTSPMSVLDAQNILAESLRTVQTDWVSRSSPISAAGAVKALREQSEETRAVHQTIPEFIVTVLQELDNRLANIETRLATKSPLSTEVSTSRRIFIVHGHDNALKNELARFLERLDFSPIILHEQPDRGQTIIEKLGNEVSGIGFVFVILTPDDVGAVSSGVNDLKGRARQNVVFEHGLFLGALGNSRVCALRCGDVEIPSDLLGVVYKDVPVGRGISSVAFEVATELKAAGYVIDANKLLSI
jgi:predicted nucleotide-binding protein